MLHTVMLLGPVVVCAATGAEPRAVPGCVKLVAAPRTLEYPNFLAKAKGGFTFRHMNQPVVWQTAVVPADGNAVFVFVGGQHHPGQCELTVNGTYALTLRTHVKDPTVFFGPKARLLFDCREALDRRGYSGVFYLWVDRSLIRPGQAQTIAVQHAAGPRITWFAVWPRADAVQLEQKAGTLQANLNVLGSFRFDAPARVDHHVGVRVPVVVGWQDTSGRRAEVEVLKKTLFAPDFSVSLGRKTVTPAPGSRYEARFQYKHADPEPMICVFKATIRRDGKTVVCLETDCLVGTSRAQVLTTAPTEVLKPYAPTGTVKTPAFGFLKPWARGKPLRVFFLTPTNYDREIIELAQRMDLDYRTTFCYSREIKGAACEKLAQVVAKADPECLVISAIFWSALTPQFRKTVLRRVADGMGLVYIDPTRLDKPFGQAMKLKPLGPEGVVRGIPLAATGLVAQNGPPAKWIRCAQFGKGRIALVHHKVRLYKRGWSHGIANFVPRAHAPNPDWATRLPFRQDSLHYFRIFFAVPADPFGAADPYTYALLVRAMVWTSGAGGQTTIRDVTVAPRGKGLTAAIDVTGADKHRVACRARDRFGRTVWTVDQVAVGPKGAAVPLPSLGSGAHFLDAQLTDTKGRVVDFYSTRFACPGGPVTIAGFVPKRVYFTRDEQPTFELRLTNRASTPKPVRLRLSLDDGWNRTLVRADRTLTLEPGTQTLTWPVARPDTRTSCVFRARLDISGTPEQAACYVTFPDDHRWPEEFAPKFWGGPRMPSAPWTRLARQEGFRGHSAHAFAGGLYGLRVAVEHFIPLYARRSKDKEGKRRQYNLDDPVHRANVDRLIAGKARAMRPLAAYGYSLGHESSLSHVESAHYVVDYDFSEPTLAKFRAHLKQKYATIERLNQAWQADFARFADVVPKTYKEARPRQANLAPWLEHRRFMTGHFTDWLVGCAGRIRQVDPLAKVGITGIPAPNFGTFIGIDPYLLATRLNYTVLYSKHQVALKLYLTYKRPGDIVGVFTGYDYAATNKVYNRSEPWRYLLEGCTEISYYHFSGLHGDGETAGYFYPDMTVTPSGRWLGDTVREIADGPGKLLFDKPRCDHGLGIYFSQNAVRVTTGLGVPVFAAMSAQLAAILSNLRLYGLDPGLVSHHEVVAHPDCLERFKVLFLPLCVSLSDVERKAIRTFVHNGGTVLIDPLFGLYDEDGHYVPDRAADWFEPVQPGFLKPFDDLKTVRSEGTVVTPDGQRTVTATAFRGVGRNLRGAQVVPDWTFANPALRMETRSLGKGRIYNTTFLMPTAEPVALWLRQRVVSHGAGVPMAVTDAAGRLVPKARVTHVADSGKDYFGIVYRSWTDRYKKVRARLSWARKAHTYDVRRRRYLGHVAAAELTLDPMEPVLLCRLDQPIAPPRCKVERASVRRGNALRVTIAQADARLPRLLYKVWAVRPDGRTTTPFTTKVWIRGSGTASLPIAHNDPKGPWTVHVREVISGQAVACKLTVVD